MLETPVPEAVALSHTKPAHVKLILVLDKAVGRLVMLIILSSWHAAGLFLSLAPAKKLTTEALGSGNPDAKSGNLFSQQKQ